jgi:hypothetical protein
MGEKRNVYRVLGGWGRGLGWNLKDRDHWKELGI